MEPPVTDGEQLFHINKSLESINSNVASQSKDMTELRVAFATLKATVDAQQQTIHSEIQNLKDRGVSTSESNWKWISVVLAIVGLLAGVIYAVMKH